METKKEDSKEIADLDGLSLKTLKSIVQSGGGSIEDLEKEPEIKKDLEQITTDLQDMGVIKIENGVVTITERGKKVLKNLNELHGTIEGKSANS